MGCTESAPQVTRQAAASQPPRAADRRRTMSWESEGLTSEATSTALSRHTSTSSIAAPKVAGLPQILVTACPDCAQWALPRQDAAYLRAPENDWDKCCEEAPKATVARALAKHAGLSSSALPVKQIPGHMEPFSDDDSDLEDDDLAETTGTGLFARSFKLRTPELARCSSESRLRPPPGARLRADSLSRTHSL